MIFLSSRSNPSYVQEDNVISYLDRRLINNLSVGYFCPTPPHLKPHEVNLNVIITVSITIFLALGYYFYQKKEGIKRSEKIMPNNRYWDYEKTWKPPLKDSFAIEGLQTYSNKNSLTKFLVKYCLFLNFDDRKNVNLTPKQSLILKNQFIEESESIINHSSILVNKLLLKQPSLNNPKCIPSIQFTALVIACQIMIDLPECLLFFSEVLPSLKQKLVKFSTIDYDNKTINEEAKDLDLSFHQLKTMQLLFLENIDWDLELTPKFVYEQGNNNTTPTLQTRTLNLHYKRDLWQS